MQAVAKKRFIDEEALLNDAYRLAVKIHESGFRPHFLVGLWRGGSTVGIYVQECLQYLGVETDHISVRTSYRGMEDYLDRYHSDTGLRAHGLKYLVETMNHDDSLLIVDDVFATGRHVQALIGRLRSRMKRNMPTDFRIAAPFYKPKQNRSGRIPDYYLHCTEDWLVLPYELTGLTHAELAEHKSWIVPILDS
ncbi:MAG: hypoxanthine phosphoribosyltransferase [Gammaproteobacteria bacterium]|nr:hypoxanthine phosphoribosyltransferase [Gammaproteobacteria bacterium]MYD75451.1 hypoxanthine phosphoribosyltransferase [Gammaproteobacteria bacterium]MYJ51164.1 hypoxanthine phosphoribosyltransferase [Gammaproteobacteria bacterium]